MKLLIISHTEHYKNNDGEIVGWAPTVNEINYLLKIFDKIYHAAMLYDIEAPASTMAYNSDCIEFVPIPSSGGKSIASKFNIISNAPRTVSVISELLKKVDYFQLRTPTGIGVYLIPYLMLFTKKQGWFKYAGNWNQKNAPLGYAFQRFLLKNQKRKVTINGKWGDQKKHCITFENPCLTEENITDGQSIISAKNHKDKLSFCYVGRLETPKGVGRIIKAFSNLEQPVKDSVEYVHLVGDGSEKASFEAIAKNSGVKFIFHGFLSRNKVFELYSKSHFFLMPTTASEGFPKVIAESMNFGCIPIVSNISSIGQYIKHNKNGILLNEVTADALKIILEYILKKESLEFLQMADLDLINKFSYQNYNTRIKVHILS